MGRGPNHYGADAKQFEPNCKVSRSHFGLRDRGQHQEMAVQPFDHWLVVHGATNTGPQLSNLYSPQARSDDVGFRPRSLPNSRRAIRLGGHPLRECLRFEPADDGGGSERSRRWSLSLAALLLRPMLEHGRARARIESAATAPWRSRPNRGWKMSAVRPLLRLEGFDLYFVSLESDCMPT